MAGIVQIPWYVTVFRGDKFELAIQEIAPVALRYGASDYAVYRMRDDRYKFLQTATFEDKLDFDRYWYGEEFGEWRTDYASWFQVPVVYGWADLVIGGQLGAEPERVTGAPVEGGTGGI
jgi:hypothetical protein